MSDLLNKSSLVMVPSGYKEDTVYSVVPSDGSGDMTLTRASNGTRVNSAGLVEVCPWNLLEQSEAFSNTAVWNVLNGASVTANTTTAPNGTTTADTLTFSTNVSSNVYCFCSAPVGANVVSVYAKVASGTKQFRLRVDLPGGTTSSNFTATTEWQRFEFAVTTTTANLVYYIINDSVGVAGDLYIWGAQLNIGSTAKPYFPTTDRLNVPRLTYQNGGGGCPSLLLEKQSTNLVSWSEDLTQSDWTKQSGISVTANQTISPDGTQNADLVVGNGSSGIFQSGKTVSTTVANTKSVWLKGVSGGEVVRLQDPNQTVGYTSCTLTTSWQRFTLSEVQSGGSAGLWVTNIPSGGIYMWGAQLEASSYPTSYIPTTSSSATRVADACSKTGISSLIGQTSGTVFVDAYIDNIEARANNVLFYLKGSGVDKYLLITNSGSVAYIDFPNGAVTNPSYTITNGRHKFAITYANNDFALYIDGVQIGVDTSGTPSACDEFGFFYYASGYDFPLKVNEAVIFPTRLTNAELASLTSL